MQLMTKEIARKLKAAYERREEGEAADKEIVVKYFNPVGAATWWIVDGQEVDGDWELFGYVTLFGHGSPEDELGYVSLNELKSIRLPFGLGIERDLHYTGHTLGEVMSGPRRAA